MFKNIFPWTEGFRHSLMEKCCSNVYCLRSEATMERMSEVNTHEFSIIGRYSTLFLPYWDYIKAWNWGFFLLCSFSFSLLYCNNIKKYFMKKKILRQMRNLIFFLFFLSLLYRCGKLESSIYTFILESFFLGRKMRVGGNYAVLGILQINWNFIMCVHWKYTIIECEQKLNFFSSLSSGFLFLVRMRNFLLMALSLLCFCKEAFHVF